MTAAEVADIGVPSLAEVLALFERRPAAVMIDMDAGEYASAARAEVQRAVSSGRVRASQVVWCGDVTGMQEVRAADPDARIFLSWGEDAFHGAPRDSLVDALEPEAFNPHWQALGSGGREWAESRGLPLSCWTVDDPLVLARLLDEGLDAVISNDIRALVAAVEERRG
jgi:glycerophosphoryl diester phosphodiesterase